MAGRALTVIVVVMGVAILAGFAVLGGTIASRMSHPSARMAAGAGAFAAAPVELPAGAQIEAISTGSDRVVLEIALPDGRRQLVIVDLATGRRLGTIPLRIGP